MLALLRFRRLDKRNAEVGPSVVAFLGDVADVFEREKQKRQSVELELDAALAKLQELDGLLRRTTPYLHGTELRDQIHVALPDTRG